MTEKKHPDITPDAFKRMKKLTLRKLGQVSGQIEELLAGANVTLMTLPLPGDPDPEGDELMRLRQYKKLLNDTLKRMAEGPYGFCGVCFKPIRVLELEEMPWSEICGKCASEGKEIVAGRQPEA